jgi:uncharacterized protein YoxC
VLPALLILLAAWLLLLGALLIQQHTTNQRLKLMAENQAELAAELRQSITVIRSNTDQVVKGQTEVVNKIRRLEEIIAAGGPITQELKDLAAELRTVAGTQSERTQALDDIVPDAPPA